MQPTHQTSDRLMAEARLGPEPARRRLCVADRCSSPARGSRSARTFRSKSPNPFPGLAAAISRQDMNGQPPGGWLPSERVTLRAGARRLHPRRGLRRLRRGQDRRLEPGKWADFILVDRDPTTVEPQALARTQVLETWVGGKKVWARAARLRR